MQRVTITLPEEDARALRDEARADGNRGMGSVVRAALPPYLASLRNKKVKAVKSKGGKRA